MDIHERQLMHRYIDKLKAIKEGGDKECDHGAADTALLSFLRDVGFGHLANAYEDAEARVGGFWRA